MIARNPAAARQVLHALVQREPGHSAAHMTLGHIAWANGCVRESTRHVLRAAQDPPAEDRAVIAVAMALLRVGETVAARECFATTMRAWLRDIHVHPGNRSQPRAREFLRVRTTELPETGPADNGRPRPSSPGAHGLCFRVNLAINNVFTYSIRNPQREGCPEGRIKQGAGNDCLAVLGFHHERGGLDCVRSPLRGDSQRVRKLLASVPAEGLGGPRWLFLQSGALVPKLCHYF